MFQYKSFHTTPKFKNQLFRKLLSFILYSTVGYFIGIFILYNNPEGLTTLRYLDERIIFVYIPFANIAGFANNFILIKLNRIVPWKPFMLTRFSLGFLASFLLTVILFFLAEVFVNPMITGIEILFRFSESHLQLFFKLLVILAFILFVFNLIHLSLFSYRVFFIHSLKLKKIKNEQIRLHIEALKNQLTPHYLFNNLNTISSLISRDKMQTEKYIRSFVNTCRFMIENSRNLVITIKEELDFVKSYLFLMEIRFPGLLKLEVSIPDSINDRLIPPLSIQLVVENAIKHNSISSANELYIKIYCSNKNYIVIENNIIKGITQKDAEEQVKLSEKKTPSTKIGLNNLKERFAYLSENPVIIEKTDVFSVNLPIINHPAKAYAPEIA